VDDAGCSPRRRSQGPAPNAFAQRSAASRGTRRGRCGSSAPHSVRVSAPAAASPASLRWASSAPACLNILNYRLIADEGATSAFTVGYFLPIGQCSPAPSCLGPVAWNLFVGTAVVLLGVSLTEGRLRSPDLATGRPEAAKQTPARGGAPGTPTSPHRLTPPDTAVHGTPRRVQVILSKGQANVACTALPRWVRSLVCRGQPPGGPPPSGKSCPELWAVSGRCGDR